MLLASDPPQMEPFWLGFRRLKWVTMSDWRYCEVAMGLTGLTRVFEWVEMGFAWVKMALTRFRWRKKWVLAGFKWVLTGL